MFLNEKILALKNKETDLEAFERVRASEIEKLIRKRYSLSAELAILRQRDTKPEEFKAYNEYAEECKAAVKKMLEEKCIYAFLPKHLFLFVMGASPSRARKRYLMIS